MHELSLCQSMVAIVDRAREGRPVATVHLRVGRLRQVVPETLGFCWELVTEGTGLAGSALEIDQVAVVVDCTACAALTTIGDDPLLRCGSCGSAAVRLVTGEELLVTSLDLADEADPRPTLAEGV